MDKNKGSNTPDSKKNEGPDVYGIKADLEEKGKGLKRDLKGRHLFMISIGGVIGTGIFMGSGYSIAQAGPLGAVLVYSLTGIIMFITMRCLGEMSVFMPVAGSFQAYSSKFVSPGAGFAVGWFYWLNYAISVPFEIVISAELMQRWVSPEIVSVWTWGTIFAVIYIVLNVFAVKYFGEAEFWFCSVKVMAIVLFIIIGICQLLGILGTGSSSAGLGNLIVEGTLFPTSFGMIMTAFITVAFSYNGTEIIGLTAGESSDPTKQLKRSVNNTAFRTLIFYVGSIFVLVATVPYQDFVGKEFVVSPFCVSLENAGIPFAYDIMNFVIITSALSCGNSLLYSCMRLLFGMATERQAPKALKKVTKSGVPRNALIFTMIIVCLYQLTEVWQPAFVALFLVSISSLAGMINWAFICLSQIRFRNKFIREGGNLDELKFKMFGFPIVSYIGLILNIAMISAFAFLPGELNTILVCIPTFFVMWFGYDLWFKKRKKND